MSTYRIVRLHKDNRNRPCLRQGLTLEEAQEHCSDPETSSSTATVDTNIRYTKRHGDWFDAYEEE